MVKILLVTNGNAQYENRIKEMLEDHGSTYRIDYEVNVVNQNEADGVPCDFAISLVKFFVLDGVKLFDGLPIATDSCGEKIEKDILNQMLKVKVKQREQ